MSYEYMLFEVKDGIALVTFNRPDSLNALSPELVEEFFWTAWPKTGP